MIDSQSQHLNVLEKIEAALAKIYIQYETLTDSMVMTGLGKGKIAIQQQFGYGKGQTAEPKNPQEAAIIAEVTGIGMSQINQVNNLQLDVYVKLVEKIVRSVDTHRQHGVRGYFEFIKNYV